MSQIALPLTETVDIPQPHFYALSVCNSAGAWAYRGSFYELKNELLQKYGHEADYDLQHIVKKCHSCDGNGNHTWGQCWNCDKGVYQRKDVVLKRYLLNGAVFHKPMGELVGNRLKIFNGYYEGEYDGMDYPSFRFEPFDGKIVAVITGLIKHEPMKLHPIWAYYYLLWHYDRDYFYKILAGDLKNLRTNTQYKLKKLLKLYSPLRAYADFFEVKKPELAPIDDLPF